MESLTGRNQRSAKTESTPGKPSPLVSVRTRGEGFRFPQYKNMEPLKRKFTGIWIPADLWLSESLTLQEKVFLAGVDSLGSDTGYFTDKQEVADFFHLTLAETGFIINSLVRKGWLTSTTDFSKPEPKTN